MDQRHGIVDGLLVIAARGGDIGAFERLAARWHPRLLRHARRLTCSGDGARDVVQDAWVAIVRGLGRLHDPATFGAWALSITGRRAADWIAKRRLARGREAALASDCRDERPPGAADDVLRLREALRRLDRETQILLSMLYVEGYAVAEIAQACGIPHGTVKSRLYHARARLRAALEVTHDEEERH